MYKLHDALTAMPWLILAMSRLAAIADAQCECGYSVNLTSDPRYAVFTDLMENDFLHTKTDNTTEAGWRVQEYNVSAEDARGPYGKHFMVKNIETNPLKDTSGWSGDSDHGGDAGLQLWVRGDHSQGYVSGAEMASVRDDALYGSFRVGMKLASQSGTCGAFFWFFNNSQEIDMEFLSKQFGTNKGAVNLVLQTPESVSHGYDASNTSEFKVQPLPFRPDGQFHEYRFDWTPDRVAFYVDGRILHEIKQMVPTMGGRMFMNHWSNGDRAWTAGPPSDDTALTVSYIKAYFNSTDASRIEAHKERCAKYDHRKVCGIPEQMIAPDPSMGPDGAKTYFFSQDGNRARYQTTYDTTNDATSISASSCLLLIFAFTSAMLVI